MELLPFGDLPPYKPRAFVPADFKVSGWDAIEPLFDQLETDLAVSYTHLTLPTKA